MFTIIVHVDATGLSMMVAVLMAVCKYGKKHKRNRR